MTLIPLWWNLSILFLGALFVVAIITFDGSFKTFDPSGIFRVLSTIIFIGSFPPTNLESNNGLSLKTVLMPTMTASISFLISCTNFLASVLVIYLESPVEVAIFPSRDIATFKITKGLFVFVYLR